MSIIKKPIISEKMTDLTEKLGNYAFVVASNANKIQIKKERQKEKTTKRTELNKNNYVHYK